MSSVQVKICGLNDATTLNVAVQNGADYIGLVFFAKSPRSVTPKQARELLAQLPEGYSAKKVGLVVDPSDELILDIKNHVKLDILQLHGSESPERVQQIREMTGLSVMKALKIADKSDLDAANAYFEVADMLLFDAKAPKALENALPGGNGLVFDWRMLQDREFPKPWMLAGGLDQDNVEEAVKISGATIVDTSSGVEFWGGMKDPDAVRDFIRTVHAI